MKCPSCGEILEDDSIYCAFCGENILFEDLRNHCEVFIETASGVVYRPGNAIPRSVLGNQDTKVKIRYNGVYPIKDICVYSFCIYTNKGEEYWNDGYIGDGKDGSLSAEQANGVPKLPHGTYIEVGTMCASFKLYGEDKQFFPNRVSYYLD